MANYIKIKKEKQTYKTSEKQDVLLWLIRIQLLAKSLHEELTQEKIGDVLDVKRQSIGYHAKKQQKEMEEINNGR